MEINFFDIICTFIESIFFLMTISILQNDKNYVIKNKVNSLLFIFLYVFMSYWTTKFLPLGINSFLNIIFTIIIIMYTTKSNFYYSLISFFFVYFVVAGVEFTVMNIFVLMFKMTYSEILVSKYLIPYAIVSKSSEFIIFLLFFKTNWNIKKLALFKKENSIITFYLIILSLVFLLFMSISIGVYNKEQFFEYSSLTGIIFVIIIFVGVFDFKEREKLLLINNKYQVQEKHITHMESIINIIRKEKHDYSNHINTIQAICSLNRKNSIERIKTYLENITQTVNKSLKFYDTGNDYIDGLLAIKYNYAQEHKILFDVLIEEPFKNINIHETELISIISNLIDNAFESFKNDINNKEIYLSTYTEDNYFCFVITDNGQIIPPEIINKIFDRGFSTKKEKADHGYGLFITKNLVNKNNGEINVESTEEFTKFCVKFRI